MASVICATSGSEAKAVIAAASEARGQRSHSRSVSRRKMSSRVRSGNILISGGPAGPKNKGGSGLPLPPIKNPAGFFGTWPFALRREGQCPPGSLGAGGVLLGNPPLFGSLGVLGRDDRHARATGRARFKEHRAVDEGE